MRPRLLWRGNPSSAASSRSAAPGFNETAPLMARKWPCRRPVLVLGNPNKNASGPFTSLLRLDPTGPIRVSNTLAVKERERLPGFPGARHLSRSITHRKPTIPSDNSGPDLRCPGFPEAGKLGGPVDVVASKIHQQQLILILMDDFTGNGRKALEFTASQRAQKHAELNMLAMVLEELEQLGPPLVVRDVVGAEVNPAVVGYRTTGHGRRGMSPRSRRTRSRA